MNGEIAIYADLYSGKPDPLDVTFDMKYVTYSSRYRLTVRLLIWRILQLPR